MALVIHCDGCDKPIGDQTENPERVDVTINTTLHKAEDDTGGPPAFDSRTLQFHVKCAPAVLAAVDDASG